MFLQGMHYERVRTRQFWCEIKELKWRYVRTESACQKTRTYEYTR
jgi:hypothetical protein